ncbi:MAG: Dabb family protein [Kiritimatiellales bacterium]|nr:Dabb family protein [Kiritimatiellales bacterium]
MNNIMVKHIVMWRFRDGVAEADKLEMKRRLEALKGVVPGLVEIEIGMNVAAGDAAKDMVLCSEFQSLEDLKTYAVHPEHLKVVEFVKPLVCERAVVDYEG